MNEHPGVRPVVVQPEQPAQPPVRSLPRNSPVMPVGITANSVGLGDSYGQRIRRLLAVGVPLVAVLALTLGVWLALGNTKSLRTFSITNGVYVYDFLFYKSSETVNLLAGSGLKAQDKALVIAKPTNDEVINDCSEVGKQWKNAFTTTIEGVERPVCVLNDSVYLVTFYHGKAKHLFEITYMSPHDSKPEEVKQITQSIKVSLE
jgi:hypothetical protein